MGKKLKEGFSDFVQPTNTDPVKPTGFSAFVRQPLQREEARSSFERTSTGQGDSQYDEGLVFGMNQMKNRAENQPWYDQVGNAAKKTIPGIGLGIIENAGYIGELFSGDQDYTNSLTEFAKKNRQDLEESNPNYRENPEELIDWKDPAWWIDNGQGLVESIGEFLVTGAGVGATLGKTAGLLNNVLKSGRTLRAGVNAAAQLGTASTLAYTEGAMSGANVYAQVMEEVNNPTSELYGNPELAKIKASEAASHTVMLNTVLNTGLNLTAVTPLFKTLDNLHVSNSLGLNRLAGEDLMGWGTRLGELATQGIPGSSLRAKLVGEMLQEGVEEQVNLFAEGEGKIKGGIEKASSVDPFRRFLGKAFSEEGLLNFGLGAIGGLGQTAGMDLAPVRKYTDAQGNTSRVSTRALQQLQQNTAAQEYISTLREDINYLVTKQDELNTALSNNNQPLADKAREDLFNIAALKSIREGTGEDFESTLREMSSIDNVTIGEDGKTDAMRLGYADSTQDNEYKQKAAKKASDLRMLDDEYNNLSNIFEDKYTKDEVFRRRLNIYSSQEVIDQYAKNDAILTGELLKTTRQHNILVGEKDAAISSVVNMSANVNAIESIIQGYKEDGGNEQAISNLTSVLNIEKKVLNDTLEADPSLRKEIERNKGVVTQLTYSRIPLLGFGEQLNQEKVEYNNLVANKNETEARFKKQKEEIIKEFQKTQDEKIKAEEKAQDVEQATTTKEIKKEKYVESVGKSHRIESSPDGGFDVIDNDANVAIANYPTVDEAKASLNKTKEAGVPPEVNKEPVVVEQDPVVITNNVQDNSYQGKTEKEKKEQEEALNNSINKYNTDKNDTIKAAYRSVEDGVFNHNYDLIHSNSILPNSPVTLKVNKEYKDYKEGQPVEDAPIGIYSGEQLIAYVPKARGNKTIQDIRETVVKNGEIKAVVTDKGIGTLSKGVKATTVNNMPIINKIVIGKDNAFYSGVKRRYQSDSLINNTESIENGITYAVVNTPNLKEIAIPLDTKHLTKEHADSVIFAFKMFLMPDVLTAEENQLLEDTFVKFNIDVRTPKGFNKYFKTFLYNQDLGDPLEILGKNEEKNDKRWIEFTGNGIRFMKAGGAVKVNGKYQAKEVGKNTPVEYVESLLDELETHISKMYYNSDLELLQSNEAMNVPIFSITEEGELQVKEYQQSNYEQHLKNVTDTNVVGINIGENQYTYFLNPPVYIGTSFMATEAENNYGLPQEKPQESVILETTEKPKKKLKSMAKLLPNSAVDTNQITDSTIQERKSLCE